MHRFRFCFCLFVCLFACLFVWILPLPLGTVAYHGRPKAAQTFWIQSRNAGHFAHRGFARKPVKSTSELRRLQIVENKNSSLQPASHSSTDLLTDSSVHPTNHSSTDLSTDSSLHPANCSSTYLLTDSSMHPTNHSSTALSTDSSAHPTSHSSADLSSEHLTKHSPTDLSIGSINSWNSHQMTLLSICSTKYSGPIAPHLPPVSSRSS